MLVVAALVVVAALLWHAIGKRAEADAARVQADTLLAQAELRREANRQTELALLLAQRAAPVSDPVAGPSVVAGSSGGLVVLNALLTAREREIQSSKAVSSSFSIDGLLNLTSAMVDLGMLAQKDGAEIIKELSKLKDAAIEVGVHGAKKVIDRLLSESPSPVVAAVPVSSVYSMGATVNMYCSSVPAQRSPPPSKNPPRPKSPPKCEQPS